jgi:DNA-binding transcriptional LysR family regulator
LPVADGDFRVEVLFDDETVIAASRHSRWAGQKKVELAELKDEFWVITPPESWNYSIIAESYRRLGLEMPKPFLVTYSVPLRVSLVANSDRITAFPASVLRFNRDNLGLAILPVELPPQVWPIAIVTLRNRTLPSPAHRFCDHVRAFTKALGLGLVPDANASSGGEAARRFWL